MTNTTDKLAQDAFGVWNYLNAMYANDPSRDLEKAMATARGIYEALAAHESGAQGVGDGWVPRDATSAMLRAGLDWFQNCQTDYDRAGVVTTIWTVMHDAATKDTSVVHGGCASEIAKAAARYEWLRKRVNYGENDFQMTVATLYWEVDVARLAPGTLDEAIDAALLAAAPTKGG